MLQCGLLGSCSHNLQEVYETSYGVSGKQLISGDRCKSVVSMERPLPSQIRIVHSWREYVFLMNYSCS